MSLTEVSHSFRAADYLAIALESLLLTIGVLFIYGAGVEVGGDLSTKWLHQMVWIILGGAIYYTVASIDYHEWCNRSWLLYAVGLLLLIYVLLFGKTLNNSKGWLLIPGTRFFLQPSELAKPATLLFSGWIGSRPALRHSHMGVWLPSLLIVLSLSVPMLLICLQPDTGTAMVLLPLTAVLIFMAGMKWRYLLLAIVLSLAIVPLLYLHAKPYQQARIKVFIAEPARFFGRTAERFLTEKNSRRLNEEIEKFLSSSKDAHGRNSKLDDWNAVQSLIAVGSAGVYGKGYLHGSQHVLGYLPRTVAPTDFIFAVIAEETGFIGSSTLIGLFCALILCFFKTAMNARDPLGNFLVIGVIAILSTHILVNISMTIRAAPIVGLPLPFVSYGGSFMLGTMALAGIVQSVHIHSKSHAVFNTEQDESEGIVPPQ